MPDFKTTVRRRLASLGLKPEAEADLTDELSQHLEDHYRDAIAGGASESDAHRSALAELDQLHPLPPIWRHRRQPHDVPPAGDAVRGNFIEDLARDLRYAIRSMRQSPVFVVFVLLTLGLGIGANTTVFTLINSLMLNPLPVKNSSELAAVSSTEAKGAAKSAPTPLSYANWRDFQSRNDVFTSLAAYTGPRLVTVRENGATEGAFCELATANYFATLGLTPALGRFFLPEEDTPAGARPVAVLNYGTWQKRFGGSTDILGRSVNINNLAFTVVGIAPKGFIGVNAAMGPDFWLPAAMAEQFLPAEMQNVLTDRTKASFLVVGRLKPGVTHAQAQANLETIASALAREFPDTNQGRTAAVRPIRDAVLNTAGTTASGIVFAGAALLIVVGIVLLIACSNVANLLLARSAARQKEIAVRLAMGASRSRLIRQLLTESVLLGLMSGIFGLVIAYVGLHLIYGALPAGGNFAAPRLDAPVFGFALLISLATGFLFGALPAMRTSATAVAEALKQAARTTGRSRGRVTIANALLVAQVAFSFLLLIAAALFLRSIQHAYEMDPGFQTAHLAVFLTNPGQAGYGTAQTKAFYRDASDRVSRLPGVAYVSWASNMPLWARPIIGLEAEGYERRFQADKIRTILNTVDRDYFETAGVTIDRGRPFNAADRDTSAPVAIVNEKLAHDYWPNGAIGKRLRVPGEQQARLVVGIARNANYTTWNEPAQPCVYIPLDQTRAGSMILYVRTAAEPQNVVVPVEREIRAAAPGMLVTVYTGPQIVRNGLFQARMAVTLLTIFGFLALGLASIGLYGILAYSVNQRRREIGVRMALGATAPTVLGLVLREGMSLVALGLAIGFGAALFAGRLLSTMLYGVGASDPLSVMAAALMLATVAFIACYLPARRATRVDPLAALREG